MHLPESLSEKIAHRKQRPHRIEGLADAVFAIVMTLLVLDIRIPAIEIKTEDGVKAALLEALPQILTFVLTFSVAGNFWTVFTNQFNYIHTSDRNENIIAIIFLLFISLLPFSAAFLSEHLWSKVATGFYTFNILLILLANIFHWKYCYHQCLVHVELNQDNVIHKAIMRRALTAFFSFVIVACICFFSSYLAIFATILLQTIFSFSGFIELRKFSRRKKISES
jgi:uncharacterized membrane protein